MKKNIFKRVLSFVLALTMILSLPIGRKVVSAAESTTLTDGGYEAGTIMWKDNQAGQEKSMCNCMFAEKADIEIEGDNAELKLYVAYPIPGKPFNQMGKDGTLKDVSISCGGQTYNGDIDITSKPHRVMGESNSAFGIEAGKAIQTEVITTQIPKKALEQKYLKMTAFVNVFMNRSQTFEMELTNLTKIKDSEEQIALNNAKKAKLEEIEKIVLTDLDKKDKTKDSIAKAEQRLAELKEAAKAAVEKADNVQAVEAIKVDISEVKSLLVDEVKNPEKPEVNTEAGTVDVVMMHEREDRSSMCDAMFAQKADVYVEGELAKLKLYVAYPVPAFPGEGEDGTLKNFKITYNGKEYVAESDITTKPMMTAKVDNTLFGLEAGKEYQAEVLTIELPKDALKEEMLATKAYVNVFMNTDVAFRMKLSNLSLQPVAPEPEKPVNPDPEKPVTPEPEKPVAPEQEVKPEEVLDRHNLKDGVYVVDGTMLKSDKSSLSMANNAINHNVKLTVKNGKHYLTLDFSGMKIGTKLGYLGKLQYFLNDYSVDGYGKPVGKLADVTIDSYQLNSDGSKVKDTYGTDYPDKVTFELIPRALKDGFVPLQVSVPLMESMGAGLGEQQVYLKLDWNTLKSTTANDPQFNGGSSVVSGVKTSDIVQNNTLWTAILLLGCVLAFAGYTEFRRRKEDM